MLHHRAQLQPSEQRNEKDGGGLEVMVMKGGEKGARDIPMHQLYVPQIRLLHGGQ